jgi:16S rRNA (guanine1516-N2)-methyltransferase
MPFTASNSIVTRLGVTTSANENDDLIVEALLIGRQLNAQFFPRSGKSIPYLLAWSGMDRLLIVRRDRYSLHDSNNAAYQYHPNLAIVRGANYIKTGCDHYLEAANLASGDKVIDCTLGFGTEAQLAAMVVGEEGEIIGLESVPELAIVSRNGLSRYTLLQKTLEDAMRRIVVLNADYREYLRLSTTKSADVVYFDPFFKETLEKSTITIGPLATFGNRSPLDIRSITEARRVARKRVIVKHPKSYALPDEISAQVTETVAGRKSPVAYAVITPF